MVWVEENKWFFHENNDPKHRSLQSARRGLSQTWQMNPLEE